MSTLRDLVGDTIPNDHARQVHSRYYLQEVLTAADAPDLVVDLGCGNGVSEEIARDMKPDVQWVGVDIMRSDVTAELGHLGVIFYDGTRLPFADNTLPAIYSNQVFEHVRHPETLLADIARVLQPGGVFVGSTSQLEPYHSWSIFNYTIYGWKVICEDAGLIVDEIRPGIDGISLMQRQWFGRPKDMNAWYERSPLNVEIDQLAAARGRDTATTNLQKLQFAGQFAFRVSKPGPRRFQRSQPGDAVKIPAQRVAAMAPLGAPPPVPPPVPPPSRRTVMRRRIRRFVKKARRKAFGTA